MKAALLYVALALAALGSAILGDRDVCAGDVNVHAAARDRLIQAAWRERELPLWEPGIWGGAPALASQDLALLYPPNVALALAAPRRARAIGLALHLVLAALGARALARKLGVARPSLAGIAYGFGGAMLAAHVTPMYVASGAWLPWVALGAVVASETSGAKRGVALSTLALSAIYLAGDPQGTATSALAALICAFAANGRAAGRSALALAAAAVLTALVCAVQLLPTLHAFAESARVAGLSWDAATRWSLWPPELVGLAVPFPFGAHGEPASVWIHAVAPNGERAWSEAYYVGPIALACAAVAATQVREGRAARAGFALALVFLALALGRHAPFYLAIHALPGSDLFRYPAKLAMPSLLGLAVAAASGLDALERRRRVALGALGALAATSTIGTIIIIVARASLAARLDALDVKTVSGDGAIAALAPRFVHVGIVSVAAIVVIVARKGEKRTKTALVLLAALDLAIALRPAIVLAPREPFERPPRVAEDLARLATGGAPPRVLATYKARRAGPDDELEPPARGFLANKEGLEPNSGLEQGVFAQSGFLAAPPWRAQALEEKRGLSPEASAILRGARFVLCDASEVDLFGDTAVVASRGARVLVELRRAPPWAAVHRGPGVELLAEASKPALDAVAARGLERPWSVVLETDAAPRPALARRSVVAASLAGPFGRNGFAIDVAGKGPGWLIVREAFADGWTATVDGEDAPVVAADFLFRSVWIGPGAKRVELRYDAPGLADGARVTIATLIVLAIAAAVARVRLRS